MQVKCLGNVFFFSLFKQSYQKLKGVFQDYSGMLTCVTSATGDHRKFCTKCCGFCHRFIADFTLRQNPQQYFILQTHCGNSTADLQRVKVH